MILYNCTLGKYPWTNAVIAACPVINFNLDHIIISYTESLNCNNILLTLVSLLILFFNRGIPAMRCENQLNTCSKYNNY